MSRKYQNSGVTEEDLVTAIKSIRGDTSCEVRVSFIQPWTSTDTLAIKAEAYTDFGARVGVARVDVTYDPRKGGTLMGVILMALHTLYGQCWDMSHAGGSEGPSRERRRK